MALTGAVEVHAPPLDRGAAAPGAAASARLLKESALLYGSTYVFIALKFVSGFLVATFLGPGLYGLRAAFGMAIDYEPYTQLGLYQALHREVPFHRGRGDHAGAARIVSSVFGASLLLAAVVAAGSLLGALYLHRTGAEQIFVDFLLFLGVYTIASRTRHFYISQLVVDKRTNLVSQLRVIDGLTNAVCVVVLVYFFALRGLFVGLLIAQVVQLTYVLARVRWIPRIELSAALAWRLIRIGFPIMLVSVFSLLFKNTDKLLILGMLSREMLGYFAAATIISKVVFEAIADVFRVMFFPRLMEHVGRSRTLAEVRPYMTEPTVLIAFFVPVLIGAMYLSVHLPLRYVAPEYMPALSVARILVLGQFFFAIALVPLLVCVALNRQNQVVLLTCAAIGLDAVLNYAVIRAGWGIDGVAVGTGLSYGALGLAAIVVAFRRFGVRAMETLRFLGLILTPFVYAVALLLAIETWVAVPTSGVWGDLLITALKVMLFVLLFGGILLLLRSHPAWLRVRALLPRGPRWATATARL